MEVPQKTLEHGRKRVKKTSNGKRNHFLKAYSPRFGSKTFFKPPTEKKLVAKNLFVVFFLETLAKTDSEVCELCMTVKILNVVGSELRVRKVHENWESGWKFWKPWKLNNKGTALHFLFLLTNENIDIFTTWQSFLWFISSLFEPFLQNNVIKQGKTQWFEQ